MSVAVQQHRQRRSPPARPDDRDVHLFATRFSVPASSRRMFDSCFTIAIPASTAVNAVNAGFKNQVATGNATAAAMDARDTYRPTPNTTSHTPSAHNNGSGNIANSAPALVAMPLPPLNFNQQVQLCPAITKTQHTICRLWSPPNIRGATNTGTNPLSASTTNTAMPGPLPSARITLVAPMLPE